MYRLPGLSRRAAAFVAALARQHFTGWDQPVGRSKALAVVAALRLALGWLRRSATYQDLYEDLGIAKSTAGDYHQTMVCFLAKVLGCPAEDGLSVLVAGRVCLVDGTRVPTVNWRDRKDLRSGKYRCHGMNVGLPGDLHGRIILASPVFPGSWHDVHCFREAGWVDLLHHAGGGMGELGYDGEPDGVHPPIKKRPSIDLRDHERQLNRTFARIRVSVEWGSDTSRTGGSWPPATGPTWPASILTSRPPSVCTSSTNTSGRRLTYDRIKTA